MAEKEHHPALEESSDHKTMEPNRTEPADSSGLSSSQREVLERCLQALKHAKNDSHILAALLLITRLCPAGQLDCDTLHRIFEAVGLNLPARFLVTAFRGSNSSGLPPEELISLGTALLAALSTDPSLVAHPHLLRTIPMLLTIVENGFTSPDAGSQAEADSGSQTESDAVESPTCTDSSEKASVDAPAQACTVPLDEALAIDCYQVLNAVCCLPQGPEQLFSRCAVPALCRAVTKKQTLSQDKGLQLLGHLLTSSIRQQAWARHSSELLAVLSTVLQNFQSASHQDRLGMCSQIPKFLPSPGVESENQVVKDMVANLWASLRPLVQSKLTTDHLGFVLILSACLLDLNGWEAVGSPKFCCLLVNRACVEVRMGLEEPPGVEMSSQQQNTITACYRIMEAAMEQACSQGAVSSPSQEQTAISGLSLQQSRQVLGALEEAFMAEIYFLNLVDQTRYDEPFVFATFRSLCVWLAEETSCLKEDVVRLLPFLMTYAKSHLTKGKKGELADWMSKISIDNSSQDVTRTGEAAIRFLLPALCHLSAEDGPRRVLLSIDAPALLVEYLVSGWECVRSQSGKTVTRDPSLETACSALLNFAVTEPERVRSDACFTALEIMLSDALPVLLHKPRLLVLAANFCTLGLMIGRLKPLSTGEPEQRRFFSSVLSFLLSALRSGQPCEPAQVSRLWEESWEEAQELWRLALQALGGCVRTHPWIPKMLRDVKWLEMLLDLLGPSGRLPDQPSQEALQELLCAVAEQCPACRSDLSELLKGLNAEGLQIMQQLARKLNK